MSEQDENTPTTEEIREYVEVGGEPRPWEPITDESDALDAKRAAAFDRWLKAHDVEVVARSRQVVETETEWAVEYPAGIRSVSDDRADAEEDVDWIVGGYLVQRTVTRTEWVPVSGDETGGGR